VLLWLWLSGQAARHRALELGVQRLERRMVLRRRRRQRCVLGPRAVTVGELPAVDAELHEVVAGAEGAPEPELAARACLHVGQQLGRHPRRVGACPYGPFPSSIS
jgi:hypothetical protein